MNKIRVKNQELVLPSDAEEIFITSKNEIYPLVHKLYLDAVKRGIKAALVEIDLRDKDETKRIS